MPSWNPVQVKKIFVKFMYQDFRVRVSRVKRTSNPFVGRDE